MAKTAVALVGGAVTANLVRSLLCALPNGLSLARALLGGVAWLVVERPVNLAALMGLAAATDVLDGWVARRLGAWRTPAAAAAGAWLDPLCDKIFVVSLAGAVYWAEHPPVHLVLLTISRDLLLPLLVGVAYLRRRFDQRRPAVDYTANRLGKLTTVAQFGTLWMVLLHLPLVEVAAAITAAIGLAAVACYVRRDVRRSRVEGG